MANVTTQGPVVEAKPQPNVYTVLLIVAILAMVVAIAAVGYRLMAASPQGYDLTFKDLFEPVKALPASPK